MHPLSATRRRDESKGYVNVILCWIVKVPRRTPIARHRKVHCVGSLQESYVRQFVFCHSQLCKFWFDFMHKHCCTHDHFICRHARCICIGGRSSVDCAKDVCKLALLACVHAGDRMLIKQYLRAWYEQHVSSQQYLDGPMLWQEPVSTDNMTRSSYLLGKHKVDMLPLQTLVQWSGDRVRTPFGQGCGIRPALFAVQTHSGTSTLAALFGRTQLLYASLCLIGSSRFGCLWGPFFAPLRSVLLAWLDRSTGQYPAALPSASC